MRLRFLIPCALLVPLAGCYSLERIPDDQRVRVEKPFRAVLTIDPASFDAHGSCGRGLTAPTHRPSEIHLTASSGTWFVWPSAPAQFQWRNATIGNSAFGPMPGSGASPTHVWRPAVSGVYDFRAVFPATANRPEYITDTIQYVVPLQVSIKTELLSGRRVQVTVDAITNSGAPTTFDYAFCARRPDGLAGDDMWEAVSASRTHTFTLPSSGQWIFFVLVNAYQNQGTAFAAYGSQIAMTPVP